MRLVTKGGGTNCPFLKFRGRRSTEGGILERSIRAQRTQILVQLGHVKYSDFLSAPSLGTWTLSYLRAHLIIAHAFQHVRSAENGMSIFSAAWAVISIFIEQVSAFSEPCHLTPPNCFNFRTPSGG